jgi:hypothetical protein
MSTTEHPSDGAYLLELVAAGELPEAAAREVLSRAAAAGDGDPLRRLADDDAATLVLLPAERVAAEVTRRAAARPAPGRWLLAAPVLAAAATAALLLVITARPGWPPAEGSDPGADTSRVKGLAPQLVVHRQTRGGTERVAPGTPVQAGDVVQLGYVAAGKRYGVIVSVDGAGGVTRHWPRSGTAAAELESGREVLLPESFRLDAAPRFERFFLVTSDRPFDARDVLSAARALAARADAHDAQLPLPAGLGETDVVLAKELR